MAGKTRKRVILFWMLLNFIRVPLDVTAKDASFCFKKEAHHNVILKGELKAGIYTPWEPTDVGHMTIDKCTEHCCKTPDTDVVFLLNRLFESYCFCVKCYSDELCSLVKITPPASYTPITVTVRKSISKFSTATTTVSDTRILTRTKSSTSSTKSTTVKPEQKETKRTTTRPKDVTTKSAETTSDRGLRRRAGAGTELGRQQSSSPNLEVRNAHLPYGYSQTKEGGKSEAATSYNGINSELVPTTSTFGVNTTTPYITTTGPTTPLPTRVVKTERKVEGKGNDDISLQCPGALKVIRVAAFGIPGDNKTVVDFDKHCQANLAQVDGTNVCIVSLKRVFKSSYPPFIKTVVTYTCSYTESDVS